MYHFHMKAISDNCRVFVLSLFASGVLWGAPMPILDFETPEERACVKVHATNGIFGPIEEQSCVGSWSLAYCPKPWEKGLGEWPSMTLTVPEGRRDWSGFDHLSIDLLSYGEGCDVFKCFIVGPDGPVQKGFRIETTLPPRGWKRWQIPVARSREKVKPGNIARLHFFTTRPRDCRVYIDNLQLVRQTEALAQPDTASWKALMAECEARRQAAAAETARQRAARNALLRADAVAANRCADAFLLASATAMEKVRPQDAGRFRSAARLAVRLARNEYEAVQLLVTPAADALKNVRVAIGPLTLEGAPSVVFPAANVTASPVGYVKTPCEPPYLVYPGPRPAEAGWWPDPILSFLNAVDVAAGDWQSFWILVKCPEGQRAGVYRGQASVSADGVASVEVPFAVRVNDFALPKTPVIPIGVTFNPGNRPHTIGTEKARAINADPASPVNAWKAHRAAWTDFLADHLIPLFNLYCDGSPFHKTLDFEQLDRLEAQGRLGLVNLGYWNYPQSLDAKKVAAWRAKTMPRLTNVWHEVVRRGWQARACLYGCDEVSPDKFKLIRFAADELKKAFPGVPLSTTAYDHGYGRKGSPLEMIDWFTPLTDKYDREEAARARSEGKQVWWYICLAPRAPHANILLETMGIEPRLLMGAMTQKYRPDGFLYYQCAIWNAAHCITAGPYTDWNPQSFRSYNGDGSWMCAGPGGTPLSTIRLENFRDGLEDLAYTRLLEKKTGRVTQVPEALVKSLTEFALDPEALYAWRDRLADALEEHAPLP